MSNNANSTGGAGSNAGALPQPDPKLLRPHLIGEHHLIPLHKPDARKNNRSVGKAPLGRNWGTRKYSEQEIRTWMLRGHNVGVCLRDDQLVIDVDPRNFDGRDRLAELCARFGIKPDDYPCVYSGGGGRHIYMSKPASLRIRGTLEDFPGIEFKTKGTQLVAGGSVHPVTKNHYRAEDPFNDFLKPPEAPTALLQALARPDTRSGSTSPAILSPEQISELLAVVDPAKFRKYDDWLHLMMACHQASGGTAVEEFVAWAISDPHYTAHETKNREKWDTLDCEKPNGIKAGTLFKAVCDAGRPDLVAEMHRQPASEDFPEPPEGISPDISRKRFREMSFDDLSAMEAPKWLVKDLIPDGGLTVVYGQPKSCKTFWALDMALSIASGRSFHGLETRHGRVTYIAAEGGPARLRERGLAWARAHGANPDPAVKWLITERIDLTDESVVAEFIKALDGPRDLVVIDTLARCMSGDENVQKDMGAFVAGCDKIREATGASVLVVHHEGKDAGKGARGSNALRGAVDTGIRVKREDNGNVVVSVEDQRDGEPLPPMCFTLQNVPLDGIECASAALFDVSPNEIKAAGAIFEIASRMDGVTKAALDAVVSEHCGLTLSKALRRTREAIPVGQERAVRHGEFLIWFERANAINKRSGLILHVREISDVAQADVSDI
jgi:hypothetical protein